MIQALFMLVFVSIWLPVFLELYREGDKIEQRLIDGGIGIKLLLSLLMLIAGGVTLNWLPRDSFSSAYFLNNALGNYLFAIPIHETGHFVFMPLGRTLSILGGSLLEVMLPAAAALFFLGRSWTNLGSIFLFLAGRHLINVADYMVTAKDPSSVTLLSMEQGPQYHDWFNLFTIFGVLDRSAEISACLRYAAICVMGLALLALAIPAGDSPAEEGAG